MFGMNRFFHNIHLWLSIPAGIFITIICLSGAALVFEKEITEMTDHDIYFVNEVKKNKLPVHRLMMTVEKTLPDSVFITGVTISGDPERAYKVHLSYPKRAAIYIDQYSGKIKGQYQRKPFFTFMFNLHRWLLDNRTPDIPYTLGRRIVGFTTIIFVIILISGIVIWWPKNRKMLKQRLSIHTGKGLRLFLHTLHVSGGFYSTLLLVILGLTGLTWAFPTYEKAFYYIFGGDVYEAPKTTIKYDKSKPYNAFADWQNIYATCIYTYPKNSQMTITNNGTMVYSDTWGNQDSYDYVKFNKLEDEIAYIRPYAETNNSKKIHGWIYSIHTGIWGGMFSKILTFVIALIGAILPATGYYIWLKKIHSKRMRASR